MLSPLDTLIEFCFSCFQKPFFIVFINVIHKLCNVSVKIVTLYWYKYTNE